MWTKEYSWKGTAEREIVVWLFKIGELNVRVVGVFATRAEILGVVPPICENRKEGMGWRWGPCGSGVHSPLRSGDELRRDWLQPGTGRFGNKVNVSEATATARRH